MNEPNEATRSVWERTTPPAQRARRPNKGDYDVCVVGAGIAGLSVAYQLARAGKSVVVIEAQGVGSGQTGKTTAHLASVLDDRFMHLEAARGPEIAAAARASHAAGIEAIADAVARESIDCGFERLDGYLLLGKQGKPGDLDKERAAALRAGFTQVDWVEPNPFPRWSAERCLRFPGQGQFHPLRYLEGLADAIGRMGGEIVTQTRVSKIEGGEPLCRIEAEGGINLTARAVVVATNTPVNDMVTIHTKQAPYLTFAVTAPIDDATLPRGLFWDTDDPYHYVRVTREGDRSLLIIGGEDHKTGQATDQAERLDRLHAWGREVFPGLGPVVDRWMGQVMETIDGLGFIGPNPGDSPNVYIVTGDSGMGLTHGSLAGLLITDLIQGRENPWAEAYAPARLPLKTIGEFARENLNVAWQYADWLGSADLAADEVDQIAKGAGALVRKGMGKIAVHRDETGNLHACSAVCPHLGCQVDWNPTDRTWDCPCHGSRFDPLGRVLQGPANEGLKPIEAPQPAAS